MLAIDTYELIYLDRGNVMDEWSEAGFPSHCPPEDSNEYEGEIFAFVKKNPPVSKDFKSAYEKGRFQNSDPCTRRAISCGINNDYLDTIQNLFPATKGWLRAKGKITQNDGVIKQTGNNQLHYSFWINPKVRNDIHSSFEVQ